MATVTLMESTGTRRGECDRAILCSALVCYFFDDAFLCCRFSRPHDKSAKSPRGSSYNEGSCVRNSLHQVQYVLI